MGSGVSRVGVVEPNSNSYPTVTLQGQDHGGLLEKENLVFPSNPKVPPKFYDTRNMRDEANSFRSKAGTLKMLIKNKISRKAFYDFIEKTHRGKEELLDYFLFVECIKKEGNPEDSRKKFIDVMLQYKKKSAGKNRESPTCVIFNSTQTWRSLKTLPVDDLFKHFDRSQDDILIAITPLFESFLLSNNYKELGVNEMAMEKRSYASSITVY